jgi:hypothetical protein
VTNQVIAEIERRMLQSKLFNFDFGHFWHFKEADY